MTRKSNHIHHQWSRPANTVWNWSGSFMCVHSHYYDGILEEAQEVKGARNHSLCVMWLMYMYKRVEGFSPGRPRWCPVVTTDFFWGISQKKQTNKKTIKNKPVDFEMRELVQKMQIDCWVLGLITTALYNDLPLILGQTFSLSFVNVCTPGFLKARSLGRCQSEAAILTCL